MIASLILTLLAAPAPAPVIAKPEWIAKPDGDAVARYFPDLALRLAIGGRVTLNCEVVATGEVANCQVVSETPEGLGFGPAGIGLSRYFKMSPTLASGESVGGGSVRIPLSFSQSTDGAFGYPTSYRLALSCVTWNRARLDILGDADTMASLAIAEREARARGKKEGVSAEKVEADLAAAGQGGEVARSAMSRIPYSAETCLFLPD